MLQQSIILYQRGSLQRAIANSGSVCPSVRLSETLAIHAWTVQDIETYFAPHDRAISR